MAKLELSVLYVQNITKEDISAGLKVSEGEGDFSAPSFEILVLSKICPRGRVKGRVLHKSAYHTKLKSAWLVCGSIKLIL